MTIYKYKRILINRRTCSIVIVIFLTAIWWYSIIKNQSEYVDEPAKEMQEASLDTLVYQCCTPLNVTLREKLFFLKTHKTGSTTVQNIIIRFAEKHSLSIMWPMILPYYLPLSPTNLWPTHRTPGDKYHVMASHYRYQPELKAYQFPNTLWITLLRHPAALFQSAYIYYSMGETTKMTFEEFVKAPVKPSFLGGKDLSVEYKGYNMMSSDLGFDLENANDTIAVQEFIARIDREFDFVMITEYMDASLVLLANLMGWPLEYVVYLNLNAKPSIRPYNQTEQDKLVLMELNHVDTLLYNHFLSKFHKCVWQYGEAELDEQVSRLREMNRELRDRCVVAEHGFGHFGTTNYILKNYFDRECVAAAMVHI